MIYNKNFDEWNKNKKTLHSIGERPFFHEREIWWCALGANIGFEQDGTGTNFDRPALILKGFSAESLVVIPLVGRKKKNSPFYYYLGKIEDRDSTAILSQIRLVDSKRLVRKMGVLDKGKFVDLQNKLKDLLF